MPDDSAMKVDARVTSRVVTPKSLLASKTPAFFKTSAAIGTVELTGFETTWIEAFGACSATALTRSLTIEALVLKRSSLVNTWLSWDTSWDDDDFGALKAFANVLWVVALYLCACWDMGQISSDTWCTLQIEQAELSDVVVELAEE